MFCARMQTQSDVEDAARNPPMSSGLKVVLLLENFRVQFSCVRGHGRIQFGQIEASALGAMGQMFPLIPANDGSTPDQVEEFARESESSPSIHRLGGQPR